MAQIQMTRIKHTWLQYREILLREGKIDRIWKGNVYSRKDLSIPEYNFTLLPGIKIKDPKQKSYTWKYPGNTCGGTKHGIINVPFQKPETQETLYKDLTWCFCQKCREKLVVYFLKESHKQDLKEKRTFRIRHFNKYAKILTRKYK